MESTVTSYDVSDRGIRFLVGSIGEWMTALSVYSAGIIALPQGHNANATDIDLLLSKSKQLWSVKSSYSPKISTFRLSNGLGGSGDGFKSPTIFWHPKLPGIVYVNPTLHKSVADQAIDGSDASVIAVKAIRDHATAHPECVIPMTIPANPKTGTEDPALDVVKNLVVGGGHFPKLSKMLLDATPKPKNVSDEIKQLQALRDDGTLTQDQFEQAVAKAIAS